MSAKPAKLVSSSGDLAWLSYVQEMRHPLTQTRLLWLRQIISTRLKPPDSLHPEQHPYCEFNFNFKGRGTLFIGAEKIDRRPGDVLLIGPGIPHGAKYEREAQRSVTVHFTPMLLLEMGPEGDGARILSRFTMPQNIKNRVIRPTLAIRNLISERFEQMVGEFERRSPGSELKLRALLVETLVDLLRWEGSLFSNRNLPPASQDWTQIEKTLRFIHENYASTLYIGGIAKAVGLNTTRLQTIFREALGMGCMLYLRAYRISQAKALLATSRMRIVEIAHAVGFETLSHFNTSFRTLVGMSPSQYIRSR